MHHIRDLADRLVRLRSRPVVNQQQHACEALHEEEEQRDAAPVVPGRLRVNGDSLVTRKRGDLRQAQAVVDPVVNRARNGFCSHAAILISDQARETSTPVSLTTTLKTFSGLGGGPLTLA